MQPKFTSDQLDSIYSAIQCSLMDTIKRKGDLVSGFCENQISTDRFNAELPVYLDLIKHYEQILDELCLCHQINNY